MLVAEAIWALILAVALGLLLTAVLGRRGPWAAPWAIFLVLFLFIWAGGVWTAPFGPRAYGIYWMPFLFFGVLVTLLIAAGAEPPYPRRRAAGPEHGVPEMAAAVGLSTFFWLLIVGLLIAIFLGHL